MVLILMRLAFAAALFAALTRTIADADLWGHLLFGRDILQSRELPSRDAYSFTSDVAWINHEWLAEVISYGSYAAAGPGGLVAVKSALLLAMLAIVLIALRRVSGDPVVHDLLVFLAVAGTYGRSLTFRPQVFSLVLFPSMLLALMAAERGRRGALFAVPIIFLLWANLHGGWIVGMGALAIWLAWMFARPSQPEIKRSTLIAIGGASLAATVATPYGIHLWGFLGETVGLSREIADWQPLWTLPFVLLTPWITLSLLVLAAACFARDRIVPSHMAIAGMCWIGSIRVSRLDAFFVLSAVMLLAPALQAAFRRFIHSSVPAGLVRPTPAGAVALAAVAIGVVGATASRANFACIVVDEQWAPEPEAVTAAKANHLQGRMLTFFDWGEYAIWHLTPAIKVSIDGRRETVYSEGLTEAHFRIYRNAPDAIALVERFQPDYIWLPAQLGVVERLEGAGWVYVFRGPKSAILARSAPESLAQPGRLPGGARCFPGP